MAIDAEWLEYARLGISALTPIMTGVVGLVVLRVGTKIENSRQIHNELLKKRLTLFEEIAPRLNDIFCFYQAVGHWSDLSPDEVIRRKRSIDRSIAVNRYLFRSDFWEAYEHFENAHFEMFSGVGQAAKLRLDVPYIKERLGDLFKAEWMRFMSAKPGDHAEQRQAYQRLMDLLGAEVRGTRS